METVLLVAVWLFALTHLDTFVVIVAFLTDVEYRRSEVLLGHYAGFGVGLTGAILGALFAAGVLGEWTVLLGVVPLGMGVYGLLVRHPETEFTEPTPLSGPTRRVGVVTAAGIGLSGENLAVFIPFFAGLTTAELALVVALYLVSAGVLFVGALLAVAVLPTAEFPPWVDRWLVPTVLILVGLYVLGAGLVVQ